jgi:hypothetical protein
MEPLAMVVRNEFLDHVAQVPFSEQDEMVQTLGFDGSDKPFRMGVAIGALRGNLRALHPSLLQDGLERCREQRVSIVD